MMWDINQMKPLSATVVLSLFTPSFRRSTASSSLMMEMEMEMEMEFQVPLFHAQRY